MSAATSDAVGDSAGFEQAKSEHSNVSAMARRTNGIEVPPRENDAMQISGEF